MGPILRSNQQMELSADGADQFVTLRVGQSASIHTSSVELSLIFMILKRSASTSRSSICFGELFGKHLLTCKRFPLLEMFTGHFLGFLGGSTRRTAVASKSEQSTSLSTKRSAAVKKVTSYSGQLRQAAKVDSRERSAIKERCSCERCSWLLVGGCAVLLQMGLKYPG